MCCVKKYKKNDVHKYLPEQYGLICFSSFEDRCLTVPYAIRTCEISKVFVLCNVGRSSKKKNSDNASEIKSIYENATIVECDIENPVNVADKILDVICRMLESKIENLLIDISTFTHEVLLIMLRLLYENNEFKKIQWLYNGASEYSVGDQPEQVWLSKGCREVRNIIGYPGVMKPSRKNHVIVLAGFEIERATRMVELLEPDILSIGEGIEPTDEKHEESMNFFREKFLLWKNSFQNIEIDSFDFSCCDLEKTIKLITEIIEQCPNRNYILVPLNTKLSTLAIGVIAFKNSNIQVCYAIPEMYNILGYSQPSNHISIVDLEILGM